LVCLLAISALTWGSFVFRDRASHGIQQSPRRASSFLFGLFSYPVFFLGSIILAARRTPAPVFFLLVFTFFFVLAKVSQLKGFLRAAAAPYVAFGAYCSVSLFHVLAGIAHRSAEDILAGIILAAAFLLFAATRRAPYDSVPGGRPGSGVVSEALHDF